MSEFDPYLKWLGIREASRPVNHYRLLGLELFESDKDVISMAADRQMAHIRTYQSGPNGKISQKILNELARARRCLLVEEKKAAYDTKLRASLVVGATAVEAPEIVPAQAVEPPVVQPSVVGAEPSYAESATGISEAKLNVRTDPNAREKTKSRERTQLLLSLVGWVSGGLAALGVGAFLLSSGILGPQKNPAENNGKGGENKNTIAKKDSNNSGTDLSGKGEKVDGSSSKKISNSKVDSNKLNSSTINPTNSMSSKATEATPDFEMPVVWKVSTLGQYPKPSTDEKDLLLQLVSNVKSKRLKKLGSSAPTTAGFKGVKQEILGLDQPGLLIGMTYTVDEDLKIKTLHPVFRTPDSLRSSGSSSSRVAIAKPGYAVAEVQASILNPMNCIRVKFMKVTQRGLDASDSYYSSWLGREVGPVRTIENPSNTPIVGVYCDLAANRQIQTLGLIGSDKTMASTTIVPEVAAASTTAESAAASNATEFAAAAAAAKARAAAANNAKPKENIVGKSLPVISRNPIPSNFFTSGAPKELIVFVNKLNESVRVYGIDENLKERYYFSVSSGSTRSFPTLIGGSWHIKKGSLGIATYKAEGGQNTAIIDGRAPDIAGTKLPEVEGLEKSEIPSSSDRSTAMKEVKKVYGDMLSKSSAGDAPSNRRNAEGMITDARGSQDDLAMQYVMFETAKELAVQNGDCKTAMLALRELERRFEGYEFWGEAVSAVEDSGRSLGRTGNKFMAQELELVLRSLIEEAMQSGESRPANKLVTFGLKAASRNGDERAVRFYKSKDSEVDEFAKIQKQYESSVIKLAADPNNALANEQKGRYLIVTQRDYSAALKCWKLSDEEELLDIVKDETTPNVNASFLARRWQNLGDKGGPLFGRRCYERAVQVLRAAGKTREATDLQKLLEQ